MNKTFTGQRAAVLLYSHYPSDPRPRREAEALADAGMEVDLICLLEEPGQPACETINGVNVRRVPIRRRRGGKVTYILQYVSFVGLCLVHLAWRSLRKRYDLVHVHNMPDFLVFGALVPKLRGAELMLDLHDPMPELMMAIFGLGEASRSVKLLKRVEKLSIRFADRVLTVNQACKRIFASRSCPPEKIAVVMNAPDEEIFGFQPCNGVAVHDPAKPFVIMYHGSIVERHGLDLAVQALRLVRKQIPAAELRIYGLRTPFLDSVMASVRNDGLQDAVHYLGAQSLEQIVKSIDECDLGIIPNRRSVFTEINTPTRIFEYLSRGKPVIAPDVPGIVDYFGKHDLVFFELGNEEDLARQIEFVYFQSGPVTAIIKRGQEVYLGQRWSRKRIEFVNGVADLLTAHPRRPYGHLRPPL
jgi:glycosyltransferase involved in cell wall biosynthesis